MTNRGWSILELLCVSMIICLCAGMGISRLVEAREMHSLQATARVLVADLTALRIRAISLNQPLWIKIAKDRTKYGLAVRATEPGQWVELPEGIRFTSVPSVPVTFYSRGNAAPAGSLVLTSRRGMAVRIVVAPFGRVRWEWRP